MEKKKPHKTKNQITERKTDGGAVSVLSGTELPMSRLNRSISRYRCFLTTQNAEEKRKRGSGIHIWKQPQGVMHDRVCFNFFYEPESEFFLEH